MDFGSIGLPYFVYTLQFICGGVMPIRKLLDRWCSPSAHYSMCAFIDINKKYDQGIFSTPVCCHYQPILSVQTYCWLKSDGSMAKKGISGKACQKWYDIERNLGWLHKTSAFIK